MKNKHFGTSKAEKASSGKGFYIALAISIVAVGTATFFAVNRNMDNLHGGDTMDLSSQSSANEWGFPTQDANQNQSGVPVTSGSQSSRPGSGSAGTSSSSKSASSNSTSSRTGSQASVPNTYAMPLSGDIINEFSKNELVKSKTMGDWRTHDGIDIKGKNGTPVKSCADGTVLEIKEDPLWGVMVTIDHKNGYVGYYCSLNTTVNVKKGQEVSVGTVIGSIGDTAQCEIAEEQHLHFGLKKDDKWVDPFSVIKKQ